MSKTSVVRRLPLFPATFGHRGCRSTVRGLISAAALSLFSATSVAAVAADWKITSAGRENSLGGAVEHWKTELTNLATGEPATIHAALFVSRAATLRVIDQPNPPRRPLADVLAETKALAGVNGGYFDPSDAPVGLLVGDGRVISAQRKAKLLSGVLFSRGNRIDIVRAAQFSMSNKVQSALQSGPLLVERSARVGGLNETRRARRTFAAVDGSGQAALGVCSAVSLGELGQILSLTNAVGKMKVVRALNLDGGSSSAFWFAGKDRVFSQGELKTVRDFVAIVPRR